MCKTPILPLFKISNVYIQSLKNVISWLGYTKIYLEGFDLNI